MSKTLKRILLILITLIISFLLIPKTDKANFILQKDTFRDGRYWCIQMNQDYLFGSEYKIKRSYNLHGTYYTIDNDTTKRTEGMDILNDIAYITTQGRSDRIPEDDGSYTPYSFSSQFALWFYLKQGNTFTDAWNYTPFDASANTGINEENGILHATRPNGVKYNDQGIGYGIYLNALNNNKKYIGTIEIYECSGWQKIMIAKDIQEEPSFDLKLNKIDSETKKPISGAKFDVTMTGIKSVNGTAVKGNEVKFTNQTIGEIIYKNIKPTTDSESVVITVKETEPPVGYNLNTKEYKMEFKYNSSTGKWEYLNGNIGEKGEDWVTTSGDNSFMGEFTFNVKNELKKEDLIIKINKKDNNGNLIKSGSATFTVTRVSGVDGVKVGDKFTTNEGVAVISGISLPDNAGVIEFQETIAPKGYSILSAKFRVSILKIGEKYEFRRDEMITNYPVLSGGEELGTGVTVDAIQGGTLTLNVENKPEDPPLPPSEDALTIRLNKVNASGTPIKKDKATFKIKSLINIKGVNEGSTYETTNGVAIIRWISLTASWGMIEIEETVAPTGYKPLSSTFKIYIYKTSKGYEFKTQRGEGAPLEDVNIGDKLTEGVKIEEFKNNVLTFEVKNEENSGLTLELYKKLATDYEIEEIDGVSIRYEITGAIRESIKANTGENGKMQQVQASGTVTIGTPFTLEMELDEFYGVNSYGERNKKITITLEEITYPQGYQEHKTKYKLICTYLGEAKGWRVEKEADGDTDLLECPDGNIGNFLKVTLENKPSDRELEPITITGNITGKVWVKEQDGDKNVQDIDTNKSTGSKYDDKNDELLSGVDVTLDRLEIADFKPLYAWEFYYRHDSGKEKIVEPEDGKPAYPTWESNWGEKNLKYEEVPENKDPDEYWKEYEKKNTEIKSNGEYYTVTIDEFTDVRKVIRGYVKTDPIKIKDVSIGPTANGEYNYSFNLTTYRWIYKNEEHQISQYVENGQVSFKYNGVEYITTIPKQTEPYIYMNKEPKEYYSNVSEDGRETFNRKFKDVNLQNDIVAGAYGDFKSTEGYIGKSQIDIPVNGNKNGETAYQISARSSWGPIGSENDNRKEGDTLTINVNMGLLTREIDISLSTQVDNAKLKINGKETTYEYNKDILEGKLTNIKLSELIGNNKTNDPIPVNVYPTDYYYRIEDYKGADVDLLGNGNIIADREKSLNTVKEANDARGGASKELEVYVTYKVRLFAATANKKVNVKQIAYYYDQNYELVNIQGGSMAPLDEKLSKIEGMTGIMVNGSWDISNGEQYIYFTFKVNKYNDAMYVGNINGHIATITSYSTEEGLLDIDSAIRNLRNNGKDTNEIKTIDEIQFEDDTAMAEKINIVITDDERKISGNVFEDRTANGLQGMEDRKISDNVVVQLIEITENGNEYIWQETRIGSEKVTTLVANSEKNHINEATFEGMITYSNQNNKNGHYEFENIVPGNYIVRFIYGDGYNCDITPNNTKYNGVDYKSTIDKNYNKEWYNNEIENYAKNASVARDNELRRLEVMATTTEIDAGLGVALDVYATNKGLNNLTKTEKENIVSYVQKLAESKDNELYAAISKVFKTTSINDIKNIANGINATTLQNNDNGNKYLDALKKCIAYKTFMVADTSKVNVPVDTTDLKTESSSTGVSYGGYKYNKVGIDFSNVNFGVMKKPEVKLVLEKHITGLKITADGTGTRSIVEASANIKDILEGKEDISNMISGERKGLTAIKSTRDQRGFWKVETDTDELKNGANLEVEYTYVVKNVGDDDYISSDLLEAYKTNQKGYSNTLKTTLVGLKDYLKGNTHRYGKALGEYYYTGTPGNNDKAVTTRAEEIAEALNNKLRYEKLKTNGYVNNDFEKADLKECYKNIYDLEGQLIQEDRDTVIKTTSASEFLGKNAVDFSKKVKLETVLSSLDVDSKGNIPSYIAEITKYSSASGGRDLESIPGNLHYVHSKDNEMTLGEKNWAYEVNGETYEIQDETKIPSGAIVRKANEKDEFWGETIQISKRTGENKILAVQIGVTVAISVAVIGIGLVLIKKFVLIKK